MKLSEWKERYDKEHPGNKRRSITLREFMELELDETVPPEIELTGVNGTLTPKGTIRCEIKEG